MNQRSKREPKPTEKFLSFTSKEKKERETNRRAKSKSNRRSLPTISNTVAPTRKYSKDSTKLSNELPANKLNKSRYTMYAKSSDLMSAESSKSYLMSATTSKSGLTSAKSSDLLSAKSSKSGLMSATSSKSIVLKLDKISDSILSGEVAKANGPTMPIEYSGDPTLLKSTMNSNGTTDSTYSSVLKNEKCTVTEAKEQSVKTNEKQSPDKISRPAAANLNKSKKQPQSPRIHEKFRKSPTTLNQKLKELNRLSNRMNHSTVGTRKTDGVANQQIANSSKGFAEKSKIEGGKDFIDVLKRNSHRTTRTSNTSSESRNIAEVVGQKIRRSERPSLSGNAKENSSGRRITKAISKSHLVNGRTSLSVPLKKRGRRIMMVDPQRRYQRGNGPFAYDMLKQHILENQQSRGRKSNHVLKINLDSSNSSITSNRVGVNSLDYQNSSGDNLFTDSDASLSPIGIRRSDRQPKDNPKLEGFVHKKTKLKNNSFSGFKSKNGEADSSIRRNAGNSLSKKSSKRSQLSQAGMLTSPKLSSAEQECSHFSGDRVVQRSSHGVKMMQKQVLVESDDDCIMVKGPLNVKGTRTVTGNVSTRATRSSVMSDSGGAVKRAAEDGSDITERQAKIPKLRVLSPENRAGSIENTRFMDENGRKMNRTIHGGSYISPRRALTTIDFDNFANKTQETGQSSPRTRRNSPSTSQMSPRSGRSSPNSSRMSPISVSNSPNSSQMSPISSLQNTSQNLPKRRQTSLVKVTTSKNTIRESLRKFLVMGGKVATVISETLKHNEEELISNSSAFEKKCSTIVQTLAKTGKDLDERDMTIIMNLLYDEKRERRAYKQAFLESLRVTHVTNMALYSQMLRLLKHFN